jgi:DNA-binding HxlR family transcriptional regulator/putative sterol carrier protein
MQERSYQQYCGAARALDVVGDRWTLLIVRELTFGPRRFTDLLDGLPGVSRNLLTARLRALERDGIVSRPELPPPAARRVYELTKEGRDLAEATVPLVAWGARRLGRRAPNETFRPQWAALAMATFADRDATRGLHETYQYVVDHTLFHFTVDDGSIELRDGRAENPAVTITTNEQTWAELASGETSATAAASRGALMLDGDKRAMRRLARIFSRRTVLARAEQALGHAEAARTNSREGEP